MYPFIGFNAHSNKGVVLACPFSPVLRDVAYTLCLLLGSVGLNRCQSCPIR